MTLEDELVEQLKSLRAGAGLTEAKLRGMGTLHAHLGQGPGSEAAAKLIEFANRISNQEQRAAVRNVLNTNKDGPLQTGLRRRQLQEKLMISGRTLIRREISGLRDLASIIIEQSPLLTAVQRQVELTAPAEDRIADIERVLATVTPFVLELLENAPIESGLDEEVDSDFEGFLESVDRILMRTRGEPHFVKQFNYAALFLKTVDRIRADNTQESSSDTRQG
jgi:hypothetical protein